MLVCTVADRSAHHSHVAQYLEAYELT